MLIEGAPHLKLDHLSVFDCISSDIFGSVRSVSPQAQIKMQAALESFISGGVAHMVMLDHHVSMEDIKKLVIAAWESGVKGLKLYRDRCSLLCPVMPYSIEEEPVSSKTENSEDIQCQKKYMNV